MSADRDMSADVVGRAKLGYFMERSTFMVDRRGPEKTTDSPASRGSRLDCVARTILRSAKTTLVEWAAFFIV
jgi:hypothetical protein